MTREEFWQHVVLTGKRNDVDNQSVVTTADQILLAFDQRFPFIEGVSVDWPCQRNDDPPRPPVRCDGEEKHT